MIEQACTLYDLSAARAGAAAAVSTPSAVGQGTLRQKSFWERWQEWSDTRHTPADAKAAGSRA
ncbi:MAG TPA: hypothetical protein VEZ70_07055 [Allosphingosinicella sp.]|nr:hypothetical protein [Allosphingosinicella sp.]